MADTRSPSARNLGIVVVLVVGLALAAAAVAALGLLMVRSGGDASTTTQVAAPANPPAEPQPLSLDVQAPATVVAGESASFTVTWEDGNGIFSGASEDWGEGAGVSSRKQAACEPGAAPPPAAQGSYTVDHTWSEPGTYRVVFGVATYACRAGSAVEEQVSRTVTVEVRPGS